MKILHTSDWHIGRILYGRKRYEEFEAFFSWLTETIRQEQIHVVVIAGNHDSPSFLDAPKELLRALDVHVIGSSTESYDDEVLLLQNHDGSQELIVWAVP
ncbi:MAG: metallophosphoesterase family protein [Methylobacter sp.]